MKRNYGKVLNSRTDMKLRLTYSTPTNCINAGGEGAFRLWREYIGPILKEKDSARLSDHVCSVSVTEPITESAL